MRRDREDRYFARRGAITPEDTVGTRRPILHVGLEDLFVGIEGVGQGAEFKGVEPRMPGIFDQ
jgi:hypothetical protein